MLGIPLIDPSVKQYNDYLNLLVKYIPSSEYSYIITFVDLAGEEFLISATGIAGENIFKRLNLESQIIYRLGYGVELILSVLDNLDTKVVVIHSTIYNLSEYAYPLSIIKAAPPYPEPLEGPELLGWAIWTFNLRVNKSIYVDGEVKTLTHVILILEQPIYNTNVFYWNIESEILFWSIVARPAFGLAFNIAINNYLELKYLYRDYGEYFAKLIKNPGLPERKIDGLSGCYTPFRFKNVFNVEDCPLTALPQSIFLSYALGYPIGIIDEPDIEVPTYPGSILLIPSIVSKDIGRPFFTIDLNGDLMPERYVNLIEARYNLEDIGKTRRYEEFAIYLLNPDYPLYFYEGRHDYVRLMDIIGLSKYLQSLPNIFNPPWYAAVRTLFRDDPFYKVVFKLYEDGSAKADVIGPIQEEKLNIILDNQDAFELGPKKDIYNTIILNSQLPPSYQIVKEVEHISGFEDKCQVYCNLDIPFDSPLLIPDVKRITFYSTWIETKWEVLRKIRLFDESGFVAYINAQIFRGVYKGENVSIYFTLSLEYPILKANIEVVYNLSQNLTAKTSLESYMGAPSPPYGNSSTQVFISFPAVHLETALSLILNKTFQLIILPVEKGINIVSTFPGKTGNLSVIYYEAIFNLEEAIEEKDVPNVTYMFLILFEYRDHDLTVFITLNNSEF